MKRRLFTDFFSGLMLTVFSVMWLGYLIGLRILNWNPHLWNSFSDILGALVSTALFYAVLGAAVGIIFTAALKIIALIFNGKSRSFIRLWISVYSLLNILLFAYLTFSRTRPGVHVKIFDTSLVITYVVSLLIFFWLVWSLSFKRKWKVVPSALSSLMFLMIIGFGITFFATPKEKSIVLGDPGQIESAYSACRSGVKAAVFGVDGAEWSVIDRLLAEGKMPVVQSLLNRGVRVRFRSLNTMKSPLIWTSMATGKEPHKHGIEDFGSFRLPLMKSSFINYPDGIGFYRLVYTLAPKSDMPINSSARKVESIWDILSAAGKSVGVAGWWATWPVDEVQGWMISDRFTYTLFNPRANAMTLTEGQVYPPDLLPEIIGFARSPEQMTEAELARFFPTGKFYPSNWKVSGREEWNPLYQLKLGYTSGESFHNASLYLIHKSQPDFFTIYYENNDMVSHFFWQYMDDSLYPESIPLEEKARFAEVIPRFYAYWDSLVGSAIACLSEDTDIFIVSDHGFGPTPCPSVPNRGGDHMPYGVFIAAGADFKQGYRAEDTSVLDLTPTLLYLFGLPTAEDMEGKVMLDIFTDEFKQAHPLKSITSYETGKRREHLPISSQVDEQIKNQLRSLGYTK